MNRDTYKFNVDWVNVRISIDNLYPLFMELCSAMDNKLKFDSFAVRPSGGVCFYNQAYYIPECGYSSVVFAYNSPSDISFDDNVDFQNIYVDNMVGYRKLYGCVVSISGDGCRFLNSLTDNGLLKFLKVLNKYDPKPTRIDVAMDILDKDNLVVPMIQAYADCAYDPNGDYGFSCNLHRVRDRGGFIQMHMNYDPTINDYTRNITIGGRQSEKGALQLYNKYVEMSTGRLSSVAEQTFSEYNVKDYWWRLEYRCKSFAPAIWDQLMEKGVEAAYYQAMMSFGRFYFRDGERTNVCTTVIEWQELIDFVYSLADDIHFVQLVRQPYIPSSIRRIENYANRNPALIYELAFLFTLYPDLRESLLKQGQAKVTQHTRYRELMHEIETLAEHGELPLSCYDLLVS